MFFYCNFKPIYQKLVTKACQQGTTYEQEEFQFLGDNHAGIGAIVADKWELPERIVEGIRLHEGPFDGGDVSQAVAILAVADWMNKSYYYDNQGPIGPLAPELVEVLGLTSETLAQIAESVKSKVDEASQIYGMMAA